MLPDGDGARVGGERNEPDTHQTEPGEIGLGRGDQGAAESLAALRLGDEDIGDIAVRPNKIIFFLDILVDQ